ncbi:MAG: DUF480 domain-containing protein [Actinobacteria bacterium]|nr:DUF480 domain-containing protein [Actinomycetota bacterium]
MTDVSTPADDSTNLGAVGDEPKGLLTPEQGRVLGCLMEKARTTPDDYPLTANALMRACNQSTSRDPVVNYDLRTIESVVADLKAMKLVRFVHMATGRAVTKYRHIADETLQLSEAETALLAMLLLRGAQTVPELKARTERIHSFASLQDVIDTLTELGARTGGWVVRLDRQIGQREDRWTHCMYGAPVMPSGAAPSGGSGGGSRSASNERIEALEALVGALSAQVRKLTLELSEVRTELGLDSAEDAG